MRLRIPTPPSGAVNASDRTSPDGDLGRADWRFLLPCPPVGRFDHLVLLGGPQWLPDLVAEIGLARKVSRRIPPKGSADALVLLYDAGVDLAEASVCLSRGGAVYWEVERRWSTFLRSTPGAIRRRLLRAGLAPLALYWPRPNFHHAAMYLPIDVRGLLSWYVETLLDPRSFGRRAARFFLRFLARTGGAWSFSLVPRYAVTAMAGPPDRSAFALGTAIPSGAVDDPDLLPVVLLGGRDHSRRVIIFPFSPSAKRPSVVVKFWRLPDRNAVTEAEQTTLRRIRSRLDAAMGRTLPQPLGTASWGEIVAAVESYAPGPPLSHFTNAWGRPLRRKLKDLQLVFDWISEFHRQALVSRKPWDRAALQQWVEEPVASYRSAFGMQPAEERLFGAVRQRARTLLGVPLPIVWAHPDLTGANIHVDGRQITVIDWSGATARLPLFDLLYFVMLWTCRIRGLRGTGARLRCFRGLFIELEHGDGIVKAVREAIGQYMARLEIDHRFFPLLLVLNWVFHSVESFDRAEAVARGEPGVNPHPEESYVEYVRILAEQVEGLFGSRTKEEP